MKLGFGLAVLFSLCVLGEVVPQEIKDLPDVDLRKGTAYAGRGGRLTFALRSTATNIAFFLDDLPVPSLHREVDLAWVDTQLETGRTHNFYWIIDGHHYGDKTDVPAWTENAYAQRGVAQGTLSAKLSHTSSIYPEMKSDYWIYAAAGVDPKVAAPLMVWQDGEVNVDREGASHTLNTIDNLTAQHKIPPMVHIFISPGLVGDRKMRSIEYDTVDDRYPRFLRDEILPEVAHRYALRPDAYSRGIIGESSGGICALNAAWQMPDQFARVVSRIGSFTSIQWKPNVLDGGQSYPNKVRKEAKRNIRVWLQDGSQDLENEHGSWPLQNIQLANSLKYKDYDFRFSFGNGTHTRLGGQVEADRELEWVWRDYDPAKTEQTFAPDPAEKGRPFFRILTLNR